MNEKLSHSHQDIIVVSPDDAVSADVAVSADGTVFADVALVSRVVSPESAPAPHLRDKTSLTSHCYSHYCEINFIILLTIFLKVFHSNSL